MKALTEFATRCAAAWGTGNAVDLRGSEQWVLDEDGLAGAAGRHRALVCPIRRTGVGVFTATRSLMRPCSSDSKNAAQNSLPAPRQE